MIGHEGADDGDPTLRLIAKAAKELRERIAGAKTMVVLLGATGQGLEERRAIAQELLSKQIWAVVPEDDFPHDLALALTERQLLSIDEVDLIFVNIESWGAAFEFAELSGNNRAVGKLRVLVERTYHPLYGSSKGYLTDAYLTHDAVFGHVYMCRPKKGAGASSDWIPTPREIILKVSERYRQWKAISSGVFEQINKYKSEHPESGP